MSPPGPAIYPSRDIALFTTTLPVSLIAFLRISPRPREAQIHRRRRRVRPPLGHDLPARVEVDALGPVHVVVPEQGRLPPAERVVGHGHRDGHVDADHPRFNIELELPRGAAVTREQG